MGTMSRTEILKMLNAQVNINGHVIGASVGSGMTAKFAAMGGADFLLALSAGKYRIMGRSSYAGYLCYGNNNEIVMGLGENELLPIIRDTPVLFGLFASDPDIHLYEYLKQIKEKGFSGIVNYPTMALLDGKFRRALEEEGTSFDAETEAVKLAHFLDLFTVAFVTDIEEAVQMLDAGADVICVHLGLTRGGYLGAKKFIPIEEARKLITQIFRVCEEKRPEALRMIYAGPANTPSDMLYLYKKTNCQGYIGGSTFDRIPIEKAVFETTRSFKNSGEESLDFLTEKAASDGWNTGDYVEFVKQFISAHYMENVQLGSLAVVMHISPSYLSTRFKKETGRSFSEYLVSFRVEKAKELFRTTSNNCRQVALRSGYRDYAQFSKIFKKYTGFSPVEYRRRTLDV